MSFLSLENLDTVQPVSVGYYKSGLKRVLETSLLLPALPIAIATLATVAVAIFVEGLFDPRTKGPFLYTAKRYDMSGKVVQLLKVRSMIVGADRMFLPDTIRNLPPHEDPRCTRVGKIIRKYSVDELFQLLDVLSGRISLIGIREMGITYSSEFRRYMVEKKRNASLSTLEEKVRRTQGGIVNWNRIFNNNTSFEKRAKYDLLQLSHQTFRGDLFVLSCFVLKQAGVPVYDTKYRMRSKLAPKTISEYMLKFVLTGKIV